MTNKHSPKYHASIPSCVETNSRWLQGAHPLRCPTRNRNCAPRHWDARITLCSTQAKCHTMGSLRLHSAFGRERWQPIARSDAWSPLRHLGRYMWLKSSLRIRFVDHMGAISKVDPYSRVPRTPPAVIEACGDSILLPRNRLITMQCYSLMDVSRRRPWPTSRHVTCTQCI